MKYLLLALILTSCTWRYGLSASRSVPVPDTYCRPVSEGRMVCYQGNEVAWSCVDVHGYWSCEVMP